MRRAVLIAVLLVSACSSNRRLAAIETRLSAMEKAEQARAEREQMLRERVELVATLVRGLQAN